MTLNPILVSLVMMFAGSFLTWLGTYYWFNRTETQKKAERIAVGHQTLLDRVAELEKTIAVLNSEVQPLSTAFQAVLIKELTHFHTPEMDALLVKVGPPFALTISEEIALVLGLQKRSEDVGDQISESERDAAFMLPYVMKRAKAEALALRRGELIHFQLVSVAVVEPA